MLPMTPTLYGDVLYIFFLAINWISIVRPRRAQDVFGGSSNLFLLSVALHDTDD